ncbi:MAG: UDP-glucose/GDP-mannose dehydrogenase family protein [Oligoflexales bacterium]|nr:UDP-glucose/GDP-mannose dehydrogenase family protein [Oligoflexales bacterium]
MRVVMVGTGYVGLVSGTCLADVGHDVICVDLNEKKIDLLCQGISPIFEPGLEEMIQQNMRHERLRFTTDLATALHGAEIVFIAVGTPEGEDGSADLGHVSAVARSLGQHLESDMVVIVKSTVPVGTCDKVENIIRAEIGKRNLDYRVTVASNPEFLKEGDAIKDFMKPDRIVVGLIERESEDLIKSLYRPFVMDDPGRLIIMDRKSSELTKYGSNAMLATRISFMNELSQLCEKIGANIDSVRMGMGSDPRIGKKFLYAGPGYGGSCFPKDVAALISSSIQNDIDFSVLKAVSKANIHQKNLVSKKIIDYFGKLDGKTIGIWGLAFKPGTDDVREAPAMAIIENLLEWNARVVAHDPQAEKNFSREFGQHKNLSFAETAYEVVQGADALVLVTEWAEYKRPNWTKIGNLMKQKVVFDFRNQYEASQLTGLGFFYRCVGRPDSVVKSR